MLLGSLLVGFVLNRIAVALFLSPNQSFILEKFKLFEETKTKNSFIYSIQEASQHPP